MMNRRHFLSHIAGASGLLIPGISFLNNLKAAEDQLKKENKSLIIMWMGGGPTHLDTWDLKPGQKTGGEFKPIKTKAEGVEISEIFPSIADQMQHLSIVRSLVTNEGSHDRGTMLMNTGRVPNPVVQYPGLGAMVSNLSPNKDSALPGFIGVGGTAQRIGPGFLGMMYAPFSVQNAGQPPQNIKAPDSLGKTDSNELIERQRRRQRLFNTIEDNFTGYVYPGHMPATVSNREEQAKLEKEARAAREALNSAPDAHDTVYLKGFDLTISKLREVFDVSKEPAKMVDLYGGRQNQFGMGLLLARRLVEKGVSCVEVDLGGWDMHANIFNSLKAKNGNGERLDKGMAGLVQDLNDRGMLKNTVVVWMGDFGRTPTINQNNGRDHWPKMSVVMGGGNIKGGQVYGSTTEDGRDVKDDKCSVGDFFATIYKGLGIDPGTQIRDNLGRPGPIADGKPLKGLV